MTRNEIYEKVVNSLVQALGVSRSEITPETSLVSDLEAESIDFLDIMFRLEKDFNIEISRGELFPQEMLRDPNFVAGGKLTEAGAAALREKFAFTDLSDLQAGADVQTQMSDLLTVNLITDYVASKLQPSAVSA
ncbi:MAG: acyl carrier protein [Pyrinomonadaceae bacterium]